MHISIGYLSPLRLQYEPLAHLQHELKPLPMAYSPSEVEVVEDMLPSISVLYLEETHESAVKADKTSVASVKVHNLVS
ncbi:hypothetical protein ACLOJK_022577 [Asimina triloba]